MRDMTAQGGPGSAVLDALAREAAACVACAETFAATPTAHAPRPVLRPSATARILVAGQAPGTRVHASGVPFDDRSGQRLRAWMGVSDAEFYDQGRIAILPMAFCFPGQDARGADLPPPPRCARLWRVPLLEAMPQISLVLLVGGAAQRWHLARSAAPDARALARKPVNAVVAAWRELSATPSGPTYFPTPHPSWRNTAWLKRNPWFESAAVPALRSLVAEALTRCRR